MIEGYLFVVPAHFRVPSRPTIAALVNAGGDLIATQGAKAKRDTPLRDSNRTPTKGVKR
jgi:hypothetical protein